MYKMPNYSTARENAGFRWAVNCFTQDTLRDLTGVPAREFFLNPEAGIEVYKRGRALVKEVFGEDVGWAHPCTPSISYGHVNTLGAELSFPEDGAAGHQHLYKSLDDGIAALKEPVDFANAGMLPFYMEYRRKLEEAFPGEYVWLAFKYEGAVTTAWELRGEDFFMDVYDSPEKTKEFMRLSTESILDYYRFLSALDGVPALSTETRGMADDIAAMLPPDMWPEFVLPYWRQYFTGMTTGYIHVHVEDLRKDHLKYLEEAGLNTYEPAVSGKLNPQIIRDGCRVPFSWKLCNWHFQYMNCRDVKDFVYQSAADGASTVLADTGVGMNNKASVEKVRTFINTAREVEDMLKSGASRMEIGGRVSPSGKEKFWARWPE